MKKILNLGTELSREQAKQIKGGYGSVCYSASDCADQVKTCPDGQKVVAEGHCYADSGTEYMTCHYTSACQ